MARLLGPDANSRLVYIASSGVLRSAVGRTATVFAAATGATLASIATYDGTGTPGSVIVGSTLTVDSDSLLPRFWFPDGVDIVYVEVAGGTRVAANADYDARLDAALPLAGGTLTGGVLLQSSSAGGLDTFDSTSRVTVQSWQTAGNNFFGEGIRLDLMRSMSKNMIAWRLPDPPSSSDPAAIKTVVWAGAHYHAQDQPDPQNPTDVHGHWSVEVPDALRRLQTRFEIKFVDQSGNVGLDKTLVQTSAADLVVDCSNGQVLRLRTGAGAGKFIEFGNDQWGATPRWMVGVPPTPESGGNAGANFEIQRFNDAGASMGTPIMVTRSSGRVTFGGTDGSQSGVDINRNSGGTALNVSTNFAGATGAIGYSHTALEATSRAVQARIAAESGSRLVIFADGKFEWGDGGVVRDTNLYRSAAATLKTDHSLHVGATFRHLGTSLGFYNAAAVTKQAVTGSRGANAALTSLLTALATAGLITDSSSA